MKFFYTDQCNHRNSSLELLRIICIILIISHHYSVHGGYSFSYANITLGSVFVQALGMYGRLACSVFALISGYFLINSRISYKKILSLIGTLFFYSWMILLIVWEFHLVPISPTSVVHAIFPIVWGNWYVVWYLLFYLFLPFINPWLLSLQKKEYIKLIFLLLILWSIIPTFTKQAWTFDPWTFFGVMYIVGAYIRLFADEKFYRNRWNLIVAIISAASMSLSVIVLDFTGYVFHADGFIKNATYLMEYNTIFAVTCAISLFLYFKNLNFYSPIINTIAKSVIGIYLIHDNELISKYIWEIILPNTQYVNTAYVVPHAIIKIITVFFICLLIDRLRLMIIQPFFEKYLDRYYQSIAIWGSNKTNFWYKKLSE